MSAPTDVRTARSGEEVEALRTVWDGFERDVVNADVDYHLMVVERRPEALRDRHRPHRL